MTDEERARDLAAKWVAFEGYDAATQAFQQALSEARADQREKDAAYHDKEADFYASNNGQFDGVPFKLVAHHHRLHAAAIRKGDSQ